MKIYLLTFFLIPVLSSAQTFTLADTAFKKDEVLRSYQIIFEFDKAILRNESYVHLDSLVTFLNANPTLVIEVSNHCDSRASDNYSINITQKRAEAIVNYLVSKGISKERLIPKGYHNIKPIIPEEKINHLKNKDEIENAHQQNRRTEFKILSFEFVE